MPKEIINNRHHGDDENPAPFAEVGWCRHKYDGMSHVQVGVLAGGDVDENTGQRPGFFVSLDRDGINRMIRALRRARDAAFGADA